MKRSGFFGALVCAAALLCTAPAQTNADFCELSWDKPCCQIPGCPVGVAEVTLLLCNCTDITSRYNFQLSSPVPGVSFSPPTGTVTLQPGECITIPIKVYCPIPTPPGFMGVPINAMVQNRSTGNQFGCQGLVKPVQDFKIDPTDPVVPGTPATPNTPGGATAQLVVSNIGSSGKDGVSISFEPMGPLAPLEPIFVPVLPGETTVVPVEMVALSLTSTEGGLPPGTPVTGAMLINWDEDGDGVPETNSSITVLFDDPEGGCVADLNGDGIVNGADLAGLLANWGLCP